MAILVLIARDATNADPAKDQRGCYKTGDVVAVHDDSAHDGDLVANPVQPPWYLVRVTGVTKAQVDRVLEPEREADALDAKILTRRKFRLNPADLPLAMRQTLQRDRYLSVTLAQARNFIRNKRTGAGF